MKKGEVTWYYSSKNNKHKLLELDIFWTIAKPLIKVTKEQIFYLILKIRAFNVFLFISSFLTYFFILYTYIFTTYPRI